MTPITKEAFVEQFKHELMGIVVDGIMNRNVAARLSDAILNYQLRIRKNLEAMYDTLLPPPPLPAKPAVNGTPQAGNHGGKR